MYCVNTANAVVLLLYVIIVVRVRATPRWHPGHTLSHHRSHANNHTHVHKQNSHNHRQNMRTPYRKTGIWTSKHPKFTKGKLFGWSTELYNFQSHSIKMRCVSHRAWPGDESNFFSHLKSYSDTGATLKQTVVQVEFLLKSAHFWHLRINAEFSSKWFGCVRYGSEDPDQEKWTWRLS